MMRAFFLLLAILHLLPPSPPPHLSYPLRRGRAQFVENHFFSVVDPPNLVSALIDALKFEKAFHEALPRDVPLALDQIATAARSDAHSATAAQLRRMLASAEATGGPAPLVGLTACIDNQALLMRALDLLIENNPTLTGALSVQAAIPMFFRSEHAVEGGVVGVVRLGEVKGYQDAAAG